LPEGPFAKVCQGNLLILFNPFWWAKYWHDLSFWVMVQIWETRGGEVSLLSSHLPTFLPIALLSQNRVSQTVRSGIVENRRERSGEGLHNVVRDIQES
jgi:hypothetical protein